LHFRFCGLSLALGFDCVSKRRATLPVQFARLPFKKRQRRSDDFRSFSTPTYHVVSYTDSHSAVIIPRTLGTASVSAMITRLVLVVGVFVLGSEAAPFASQSDLKTAVNRCLTESNDPTGAQCCGQSYDSNCGNPATARCGVAGCDEMPSWDTSQVTDMGGMFDGASAFNADISGWDIKHGEHV
jgi:hypothetical protein